MPEVIATLSSKRDSEHSDRKFMAAIQGVDLDGGSSGGQKGQKEWEDIKSRVFSGGTAKDSNDILSLQGQNAAKAGFGIGAGLEYTDLKGEEPKNPFG
jgi:translation initiation factor 1 (eIF-1/SUI1)